MEPGRLQWMELSPRERIVLMCIVHGQKRDLTCDAHDMNRWTYTRARGKVCKVLECQTDVDITWAAIRFKWVELVSNKINWVGGEPQEVTMECGNQAP